MPKAYRATVRLGVETSTCDFAGEAVSSADWRQVSEADIDRALCSFMGWRNQRPPKASAVHVAGRRAHEIFRGGGDLEIQPRPVFVESLTRLGPVSENGEFSLAIRCGKGTYVRGIARDIGRLLGCGAHISALARESVGCFSIKGAVELGGAAGMNPGELSREMAPVSAISGFLPTYSFSDEDARRLKNGLAVPFRRASREGFGSFAPVGIIACASKGAFSIGRLKKQGGEALVFPEINIYGSAGQEASR
jgi:tRNA pseudouridine(55) synthase